ncbi:copper resistance protein CopC [Marinobacter psychrophilus]|jgi:methionine-rich copper-binding protein CopC|uniref:Copper resistance protein CopC n=1 Tax=Marinobacter psychrophilus TaxID=330734 RepID=A0A0H4IBK4_9GAMM|nr:copper resistance CopC family protein [Marinobacter psychrophilus]AKO52432.1 copper resistance protein CopC [Marinobacter psychrophilus]
MKKIQILIAIGALTASSSVFAHSMMESTFPQDGAMVMEPTRHVEVNFDMPMKLINLKVIGADGRPIAVDYERAKEAGTHFKGMTPVLVPGNYTVHWKALGDDGHMMDGTFGFMQH